MVWKHWLFLERLKKDTMNAKNSVCVSVSSQIVSEHQADLLSVCYLGIITRHWSAWILILFAWSNVSIPAYNTQCVREEEEEEKEDGYNHMGDFFFTHSVGIVKLLNSKCLQTNCRQQQWVSGCNTHPHTKLMIDEKQRVKFAILRFFWVMAWGRHQRRHHVNTKTPKLEDCHKYANQEPITWLTNWFGLNWNSLYSRCE